MLVLTVARLLAIAGALSPRPDGPAAAPVPSTIAWPDGPMAVRIALDAPIDADVASQAVGRTIAFRPGHGELSGADAVGTVGTIRIAGASLADGGRTLVLLTDPHPVEATYAPDLPDRIGRSTYDLTGVEATWAAEGRGEAEWEGWLPELDLGRSRQIAGISAEHDAAFGRMTRAGTLTLRTLLALPEGEHVVTVAADRPIEAELAFLPLDFGDDHRAESVIASFGELTELFVTIPTGPEAGAGLPSLGVSIREAGEGADRPLARTEQLLPWAPAPVVSGGDPPALPDELAGGDPARGESVFFAEAGKCSVCHRVGDRGGLVGPDLTDVGRRLDAAAISHAIESPSTAIDPAYLPYTVAMADGRVFVGVVRAEGADAIRVVGADAAPVTLLRAEVEEIRPVSTSIMPVGLAGALGREDLRDLIAYLSGRLGE